MSGSPAPEALPAGFEEEIYLRLNPDVLAAVAGGTFRSGREHYLRFGRMEGRPYARHADMPRDRVVLTSDPDKAGEPPRAPSGAVDAVKLSAAGAIFITGWVNDALDRLDCIELHVAGWSLVFSGAALARGLRPDAEEALPGAGAHAYGFTGFLYAARRLPGGIAGVGLRLKSGAELQLMVQIEQVDDVELRTAVLAALAAVKYPGNAHAGALAALEPGIGGQIVEFNRMLTRRAVNEPYVERFGRKAASYKGSIIVCLHGRAEFLFLQQATFALLPGIADYEFIYVCNSPELADGLLDQARICQLTSGLDITLIILSANAGFGAANNLAAQYARSTRLIFMNPDVFPRGPDWAARHTALVDELPVERTALFGVPLYYDDGSLMHGGMYFERDAAPVFTQGRRQDVQVLRVEHYGKGAPPEAQLYLRPRPVPAVTGAFISADKDWFESLEGFTEDYVLGHYEDADLCLKSLDAGRTPWLHDARLYHLEGKGSNKIPAHEGATAVNRWLFTRAWLETVEDGLLGQTPAALQEGVGA